MKKNKKSRQNYIVVWCIMLLSIVVSCNQQRKFNYPEAKKICEKYTDTLINGKDTVSYQFKKETATDSLKNVYIITGDDSTHVICKMKGHCVLNLIETDENGDTIYNYPSDQKELDDYVVFVYVDPVYTIKGNDRTYQLTTYWSAYVGEEGISIYIIKSTSVPPDIIISLIKAKIAKNGKLIECDDREMGYISDVTNWMKYDPYYAQRVNIEIKKVLKKLL